MLKSTSCKREAKKGSGDASPGRGLGGRNPPSFPYREAMKKKESGSEAKPDGWLMHGLALLGSGIRENGEWGDVWAADPGNSYRNALRFLRFSISVMLNPAQRARDSNS